MRNVEGNEYQKLLPLNTQASGFIYLVEQTPASTRIRNDDILC